MIFTEQNHLIKGLDPVANYRAGTVRSDIVNMSGWGHCTFVLYDGVGTTGTSTLTVNACDTVVPGNRSLIPFKYRQILTGDTPGALTTATTAGFTTTAGSSKLIAVEVDASDLAASGYGFVELTCVEVAASAVLGGILVILSEPRYARTANASAIV